MVWKSLAEVVFRWVLQVGLLCIRNKTLSMHRTSGSYNVQSRPPGM